MEVRGWCDNLTARTAEAEREAMRFWNEHARPPIRARGIAEIRQFLTGLDLVDPGLVSCALWRPDGPAAAVPHYGVAAAKPATWPA